MSRFFLRFFSAAVAVPLLFDPAPGASQAQQKPKNKEKPVKKQVLNFDGGIVFATEGGLSELTCFQLTGRATAPGFFDDFKRIDDESATEYESRLDGFDQDWSAWTREGQREYTNLGLGDYRFRVRARGISGDARSATTRNASRQSPNTAATASVSPALLRAHGCCSSMYEFV